MANLSDNTGNRTDVFELLPDVHKSEVNNSLFENVFNRHLTSDNVQRVSGYVGQGNPTAGVNKQIREPSVHRQAYQLQPTAYTKIGDKENSLSFKSFAAQLSLMGVDVDNMDVWGAADRFNWVPPINIDMLVNYQNYYWAGSSDSSAPQYITVENRCSKAQSKIDAYSKLLTQYGSTFDVKKIDLETNTITVSGLVQPVFSPGFMFYTKGTKNVNLSNKFWTVKTSTSKSGDVAGVGCTEDATAIFGETEIVAEQDIAIRSELQPEGITTIGKWWYQPSTRTLRAWTGNDWIQTTPQYSGTIVSLSELMNTFVKEANCICGGDYGWDLGLWDDNQAPGEPLWINKIVNTITHPNGVEYIKSISHFTLQQWIGENGAPQTKALWYDLSEDALKQFSGSEWVLSVNNFSIILGEVTGTAFWDYTEGCDLQEPNEWMQQNKWIHKTQLQSLAGIRRAQAPIIEFDSTIEHNEWVKYEYVWKYRTDLTSEWVDATNHPTRLELEPVKDFVAQKTAPGKWRVYLTGSLSQNRSVDYTDVFVPGFGFFIRDDSYVKEPAVVTGSEYRRVVPSDSLDNVGAYSYVTIVDVECSLDAIAPTGTLRGDGAHKMRIEPSRTSIGSAWLGYHVHWSLSTDELKLVPASPQQPTLEIQDQDSVGSVETYGDDNYLVVIAPSSQTWTIYKSGITELELSPRLKFPKNYQTTYALAGSDDVAVYLNGIRQYATYTEKVVNNPIDYVVVGDSSSYPANIETVSGIIFNKQLEPNDVVTVTVGPLAAGDSGMYAIPVRTVTDDDAFVAGLVSQTQPVYVSLCEYRKVETTKTRPNQYPSFNIYDLISGDVVDANAPFKYKEGSDSDPINVDLGMRVAMSGFNDYTFEQNLVDEQTGRLYGFRDVTAAGATTYWYSPLTKRLKKWTQGCWSDVFAVPIRVGNELSSKLISPIVSPSIPSSPSEGCVWYSPITNKVGTFSSAGGWSYDASVRVSDLDPTFRTIWRRGAESKYVPAYVNKDREPVQKGDPLGDWELPEQWFYNPSHANKKLLSMSELSTHFGSIAAAQQSVIGIMGGGAFSRTQKQYDLSQGGTIREYNGGYDTLISAVNVDNISPVGLIGWARDQYSSATRSVISYSMGSLVDELTNANISSLEQTSRVIYEKTVANLSVNDFSSIVYGDTTAYDKDADVGIRNWIATAAMVGFVKPTAPSIIEHNLQISVRQHTGSVYDVKVSSYSYDKLASAVANTPDDRTPGFMFGRLSSSAPPKSTTTMVQHLGALRPRVYWYEVNSSGRVLYVWNVVAVSPVAPSDAVSGDMYFNSSSKQLLKKVGSLWTKVGDSGDVSAAWTPVSIEKILAEVLERVEQSLYERAVAINAPLLSYNKEDDNTSYTTSLRASSFADYVSKYNIISPYENTQFASSDAWTWNYSRSVVSTPPTTKTWIAAAHWKFIYENYFRTPYPHLEPWKLQGYDNEPEWWREEYASTTSARRWKYDSNTDVGMWSNIKQGFIPHGRMKPDGEVSEAGNDTVRNTYTYFCVNIDNNEQYGYAPDSLYPPYVAMTNPAVDNRALFTAYSTAIRAPESDYVFGGGSVYEWNWVKSLDYVYDRVSNLFRIDPVNTLNSVFGVRKAEVDGLQISTAESKVYTHDRAPFHGDLLNNSVYTADGMNQWYVNFNRFAGFDTNTAFRTMWCDWEPKLTYQFAGIADTSTFRVSSRFFDLVNQDYSILLQNIGVIGDTWSDAFRISVLNIPPSINQYNNQSLWRFSVSTLAPTARTLFYYGAKHYDVETTKVGTETVCYAFSYQIVTRATQSRRVWVSGDRESEFVAGLKVRIAHADIADGVYHVESSVFEPSTNLTRVTLVEAIASSSEYGRLELVGRQIPWQSGELVTPASTKTLPPTVDENQRYYVIRLSDNAFKLALYEEDVGDNVGMDLTGYTGQLSVGEVVSTFVAGDQRWMHYALDKFNVRSSTLPMTVTSMQGLINFIDGYVDHHKDSSQQVYDIPTESSFDPITGSMVTWQSEMESFVDWAYGIRSSRLRISDRYSIRVHDIDSNTFSFNADIPNWEDHAAISLSASGTLPTPLRAGVMYYVVKTDVANVFTLSYTHPDISSTPVDVTDYGSGTLFASLYQPDTQYPTFEINPARNNVWLNTPQGIISDVVSGPYPDIDVQQTLFDQYGRPLKPSQVIVFRQDKRTHIKIVPNIPNDIPYASVDEWLHIGGGHFFTEGYEHYLVLNNYSVAGSLIYDPFLGLNIKKLDLDYYESTTFNLRPTMGGYYLLNGKFARNLEGSVNDIRNSYDTHNISSNSPIAQAARRLVGYNGRSDYLDVLNANDTTQFRFYQGMIQTKGSINSVNAYINSRRFLDARVDEFWAWKIADFGDVRPKYYPEIRVLSSDVDNTTMRLMFKSPLDSTDTSDYQTALATGFEPVAFDETGSRWVDYPEQKTALNNNPLFMDATATSMDRVLVAPVALAGRFGPAYGADNPAQVDVWYNTSEMYTAYVYDATYGAWVNSNTSPKAEEYQKRLGVDEPNRRIMFRVSSCDDVRIVRREYTSDDAEHNTTILSYGDGGDQYSMLNTEVVVTSMQTFAGMLTIFGIGVSEDINNPSKMIDTVSQTTLATIPIWDPARGHHYWIARHNIDVVSDTDPAKYGNCLNTTESIPAAWNFAETDKVWMDTSLTGYIPYYDERIMPDVNKRIHNWGKTASWSDSPVLRWVESPAAPEDWDKVVLSQQNNPNIAPNDKLTGSVYWKYYNRSRVQYQATIAFKAPVTEVGEEVVVKSLSITTSAPYVEGEYVKVVSTDIRNVSSEDVYVVKTASGGQIELCTKDSPDTLVMEMVTTATEADMSVGEANRSLSLTITKAFASSDWSEVTNLKHRFIIAIDSLTQNPTAVAGTIEDSTGSAIPAWKLLLPETWSDRSQVIVSINGAALDDVVTVEIDNNRPVVRIPDTIVRPYDFVDVVSVAAMPSDYPSDVDLDISDDGTVVREWKRYCPTTTYTYEANGSTYTYWYFWVRNSTTVRSTSPAAMPPLLVEQTMQNIPTPYMILMSPKDDTELASKYGWGTSPWGNNFANVPYVENGEFNPIFYRKVVLCKLSDYIASGERSVIRFTRDMTLRNATSGKTDIDLKNKHEEWMLIRQYQSTNIPKPLWDAMVESIVGYKLTDRTVRVPSLDRELYDAANNTTTRYGLGPSQSFVDGTLAKNTILAYLTNPDVDFYPMDINTFFEEHSFDTSESTELALEAIYNTFGSIHVNTLWFTVLLDALTSKSKYKELMKTSWVAVYGIRIFEAGGIFDE